MESVVSAPLKARRAGIAALAATAVLWAGFSVAHLLTTRDFIASEQWLISKDGGYAEYFQYALMIASAAALLRLYAIQREALFAVIAFILGYLFVDDAFQLHEQAGVVYALAGAPGLIANMSAEHFGELVYLSILGAAMLAFLISAAMRAKPYAQQAALIIGVLVSAIGFCSVFVDALHAVTGFSPLGFLEDSGEILAMGLIASYCVLLSAQFPAADPNAAPRPAG